MFRLRLGRGAPECVSRWLQREKTTTALASPGPMFTNILTTGVSRHSSRNSWAGGDWTSNKFWKPSASVKETRRAFGSDATNDNQDMDSSVGLNSVWSDEDKRLIRSKMKRFARSSVSRGFGSDVGIPETQWGSVVQHFRKNVLENPDAFFPSQENRNVFIQETLRHPTDWITLLQPLFLNFAVEQGYVQQSMDLESRSLLSTIDMTLPHEWFPEARKIRRKIIYHGGPTNSGKTFTALERLKQAGENGGVYCGPLRLLALEVFETLNYGGTYCSLVTGQEKKEVPFSSHLACTVEMCNVNKVWDVAVIDEIQLIGDVERGWAWTRALTGLRAQEVHVCGSMEAVSIVQRLAQQMGDDFEVFEYERRNELTLMNQSLNSYANVQKGDCIVAFSRKSIFEIKSLVEASTGLKCCVIYGQLPPETRSQQARLFNQIDSGYDVLIASDAVGMGLNLNIQRVILDSLQKYNGKSMVDIPPSLVKQICGRAGRFGSSYASGFATCLNAEDLSYLHEAYHEAPKMLDRAGLFPSSEQMEDFAAQLPTITSLADLTDKFVLLARLDGDYYMCNHEEFKTVATVLHDIPLTLGDRFIFCTAPTNLRHPLTRKIFVEYAKAHYLRERVPLQVFLPKFAPKTNEALRDVEVKMNIIDLYLWLSFRFEYTFVEREEALTLRDHALELVQQGLLNTSKPRIETRQRRSFSGRINHRRST